MNHQPPVQSWTSLAKRPSGFLPLVMSMSALALLAIYSWRHGLVRETDEGTLAHLWQILMVGQIPVIGLFLFWWLGRAPKAALTVFGIQVAAGLFAAAPVFLLGL